MHSRPDLLKLSSSHFDPEQTSPPSLKLAEFTMRLVDILDLCNPCRAPALRPHIVLPSAGSVANDP